MISLNLEDLLAVVEKEKLIHNNLSDEHNKRLQAMIKDESDENRQRYREIRLELDKNEYKTMYFLDIISLLKRGVSELNIINEFKVRLNRERDMLSQFEKMYKDENPLMVGTPLYCQKLKVEVFQDFVENELL